MRQTAKLLIVIALLPSLLMQAMAQTNAPIAATQLPTGGKVVGGQATLQSSGSTLNVNQATQRGVVEWNTFNVGAQARVNFNQPSASAVTLNRVLDMNASQILGRISATGQVFISNPNGVIFGSTAQVDVGGLVATTKGISNADFMSGKTTFEGNGQAGSVINQGTLQAALGGYIALLAPQVRNEGVIVAREGTVALTAGDKTTLEFNGTKLVSVIIDRPVIDALVENKQLIRAEGGFVVMSARSANALMNSVIKQTGTIEAPSLVQREGRILLEGGEKGVVSVGGVLNVSGTQAGTTGGRMVVTGDKVAITENALLDATGQTGGGQINIGGGWQGQDPTIRQANATRVEAGARLDASAIQSGNGGEIVVWSDTQKAGGMTQVSGDLKARGGATQGNGGRIETSGHWLSTRGATGDARAPNGTAGQWLFDPYNVTITSTATQNNAASTGTWTPSGSTSEIQNTDINALLNAGTNVTVTTGSTGNEAGNITVDAAITQNTTAPAARLTLTANQDIAINQAISLTKSGSKLELNAGNANSGGNIALTGAVAADTLNMNLTGAGTVTQTAAVNANNLRISGANTQVTLNNASNSIGVVAANVASLNLKTENGIDLGSSYGKGLYVGTVEGMSGVTATGDVNLVSRNTHIFVDQNISTTSTTSTAIQLNAGESLNPGAYNGADSAVNPYGANVVLSTGRTITTGSGGRATLYTGASSGSGANLATYIGSGSGRFRYNSDELVTNYSAALSSGLYAIYRQNANLTVTANNASMVYGDTVNPSTSSTVTGYLNGDTLAQSVSTGATVAIAGTRSTAGYLIAGNHALTASGAAGTLGYGFSYTDGTLAVTPKSLTISATASNKVYDASAAATSSLSSNQLQNDVLTLGNTTSTFNNKNAGTGKTVTVSGLSISGTDAANYSLANTSATATANVTAKALTASFTASNKVYDGTTAATVAGTSSDIIAGDTVTFTKTSSTFSDKNVGNGKTVSVAGIQLAGTDGGNYALANSTASTTANITAKSLTASFIASNKEYDGNTNATVTGNSAQIVSQDVVTIANTGATFSDKNAGTGKTVSVTGVSISGTDAGNYSLANLTASTTANISTKALTISGITAADKTYDGLTTATVNTAGAVRTGLVVGDVVNISTTGQFNNKNVGTNKAVALTSTYSGSDATNYNITSQAQTTASVTPRILAVTATANDKTYDTTRTATYTLNSDKVAGDALTLTASTALFDTKNAAAGKTVSVGGIAVTGTDASNYTLQNASTTTTAEIRKADLAITGLTANSRTYDGTVAATLTGTAAISALQGDTVSLIGAASSSFASKDVGTAKAVTTTGLSLTGTDAGNYNLINPALTANITPKALTISGITAANKEYNGTTAATISTAGVTNAVLVNGGLVNGDTVVVAATGTFANKNVGTGKTVQLASSYTGSDVGNYTITNQASTTADITAKALTISGLAAVDKVYDGNSTATVSNAAVVKTGLITGDVLTVNATGNFRNSGNTANDKNVGTNKDVVLSTTYGGADVGNYTITDQTASTASITPKALTISGITAANREYDGSTAATVSTAALTNTALVNAGMVNGDNLTVSATGTFANKAAGNGKTVQLVSSYGGSDATNYTITDQATTTANITPKALTISGITAANKEYNGTTAATISTAGVTNAVLVNGGLVNGDTVVVAATGTFANKNVGTGKTVQLASSYTGSDVGNYTITNQASTTADITAKALTISGLAAVDKVYDGNSTATVSNAAVVKTGLITGDVLTVNATGNFRNSGNTANDKNVGTNKDVVLSTTYGGADVGNYTITDQTASTASITPKALTISGITAANREYDGSTAATVSTAALTNTALVNAGMVNGDNLTVSATGTFANKAAGNGKTVQLVSSYGGSDATNYTITDQATTTANITPKALTISGITAANKEYNGTTAATISTAGVTNAVLVNGGLVNGDTVVVAATGTFANKNVGTGKTVQLASSYTGSDVGNYTITNQASTTADITAKALTISGLAAVDKVYDGNSTATVSNAAVVKTGLITGDVLTVNATGNFRNSGNTANDKNVGTNKDVVLSTTYGGADVGNYTITDQTASTASITPKALTISGITAANKQYNGNTTATVITAGVTNAVLVNGGLVNGDDLTVSATGTFADKNVGTNKAVALASSYSGADVNNYTISNQAATTASITKKDVTITALKADDKLYNASTTANISSGVITGTVDSETLLVSGAGTFDSINPGANKTVTTPDAAALTKKDGTGSWSNYNLTNTGSMQTTASIVPVANNCVAANGCINLEPTVIAKLNTAPATPTLTSNAGALQIVKPTTAIAPATTAPVAPAPVLLMQPISSASMLAKSLSPGQVAELAPAQLGPLIKSLDRTQLLAITEKQMSGLNVNQLDDLIGLLNRMANPTKP